MMGNYENIKISNHCKQRYVERITGIVDSKEIKRYLATEENSVVENIHKMLHYGNIIYDGKNFEPHDSNVVKIVLNGTWLVFVGKDSNTAITMYKIDLGLGEEFNKSYVSQFLKSLEDIDLRRRDLIGKLICKKAMWGVDDGYYWDWVRTRS